ncbi:MAG: aromatic ring-hydroxylating oxygenase subunit alpha, partial [Solirubrobacteraceae bacterium]
MDSIVASPTSSSPTVNGSAAAPWGIALEPRFYTDPTLEAAEQELIFERTWQLAGHISQLANTGSYITAAAGSQPVLVVRDDKGSLRAYRNVCRHRGSRLLSGSGQCKAAIRCRYHGWTYKMDGSLIGVPEGMAFGEKLDKKSLSLMPVRVEEMCGLVFVNLDSDAAPLAELVGDLPQRLAPYRIETLTPLGLGTGSQPANWKVVADNYIEGYHIPIAHPGLMRMLDYKHYDVEVNENYL